MGTRVRDHHLRTSDTEAVVVDDKSDTSVAPGSEPTRLRSTRGVDHAGERSARPEATRTAEHRPRARPVTSPPNPQGSSTDALESAVVRYLLGQQPAAGWASVGDLAKALERRPYETRDALLRLETLGRVERSLAGTGWRLAD